MEASDIHSGAGKIPFRAGSLGDPYGPEGEDSFPGRRRPRRGRGWDPKAADHGEGLPRPGRPSGQDAYSNILASHSLSHTGPLPDTALA
jgi:hypothetical protein